MITLHEVFRHLEKIFTFFFAKIFSLSDLSLCSGLVILSMAVTFLEGLSCQELLSQPMGLPVLVLV